MQATAHTKLIWRIKEVSEATGLGRVSIYNRMNPESPWFDPTFPRSFKLGTSKARSAAVGWLSSEVIAWVMAKLNGNEINSN
ncbi:helix-turn-helix transcriptional regulator [Chromobacterium phragmitis]|uniref:AlpA family phage regulatory protein n=1 Tax=Chromobacterium phragmitis TaxID=2202141 RepID=A0ABV0ISL7_9NEIS